MKFSRRPNDVSKYVQSLDKFNHMIRCTDCQNRQDFDKQSLRQAKVHIIEAGWREGIDEDKEAHCLCPECVETLEQNVLESNELELNSYD